MPDKSKKFHEFALKSILFKGRADWYFCFLKTERIAHVLTMLATREPSSRLKDIAAHAQSLPADIARLAAGELSPAQVLGEIFALMSDLRLAATAGVINAENASVLVREFEHVAERLSQGAHPSPFVGGEDFFVPELSEVPLPLPRAELSPTTAPQVIKDIKGHKGQQPAHTDRVSLILSYIRKHKGASIKDIAAIVPDCSEKTVQRELNTLIAQGVVRRVGSRRWSLYEAV